MTNCLSSPKLAFHTGAVIVPPNPSLHLRLAEKCGLILHLELSVCHQSCLAYLVIVSLVSLLPEDLEMGLGLFSAFLSVSLYFSVVLPLL